MEKKFINKFFQIPKFIFNYIRKKVRTLFFDYKIMISKFSVQKISTQKKILIKLIYKKNFSLLENCIQNRKIESLRILLRNLQIFHKKKIIFIYIYSYLINIHEYRLANIYHRLLCQIINKNCFFYFQISTLNQKNISKFRLYSQTFKFRLIYMFLLFRDEKKYIKTILKYNRHFKLNNKDKEYKKYLKNKKINVIGPLSKKINFRKKKLRNDIIIRFKNNNHLTNQDYHPDITYLNGTASKQYFKQKNFLSSGKNLKWVVYINKSLYKRYKINDNFNNRFADNTAAILFTCFTELNLLQKVLLDLILFNPKEIKLYNFNIKLTKKTQIGYGINNTIKKQMKSKITFNHNQIVMFDFINFFYKKRIALLDDNLKSIISNGKDDYLKKLEKTWKKQ